MGDASPHREFGSPHRDLASPHRDLGTPHRDLIKRKRPNSSPNIGEKPLQFPAKTSICGVHSISSTELRNFH